MPNINERKDFRYITKKRRVTEDRRFVTGRGNFAADNNLPGTLHVAMVTSPYACAEIKGIDSNSALALPGVRYVPVSYTHLTLPTILRV